VGSAIGSFLEKELLHCGKTECSILVMSCLFVYSSVIQVSLIVLFMASGVGGEEPCHHHCRTCATRTPSRRSLGLSVACRVVWSVGG
jgi:hypothetical protein